MTSLRIPLVIWNFLCGGCILATVSETTERAPGHAIKKCVQGEDNIIVCTPVKPDPVDVTSRWPPGPYAIPMSLHGCPESSIHGWTESYLLLTWENRQEAYVHISTSESGAMPFETLVTLTKEPYYHFSYRHIFGPAKQYTFKMNFCFKYRNNASLDSGSWPDGNYSIYATVTGCPKDNCFRNITSGFERYTSNISLPNISRWESDGYTPDFKIINDSTEVFLEMQLCSRTSELTALSDEDFNSGSSSARGAEISLNNTWTHFFFLKTENLSCPMFENYVIQEETIHFEQAGVNGTNTLKRMTTLCHFEGKLSANDEDWLKKKMLTNAFPLKVQKVTEGQTSKTSMVGKDLVEMAVFKPVTTWYSVCPWTIMDLGRTTSISAVQINFHRLMLCSMVQGYLGCTISKGKWDFLYSEAVSCVYVLACANFESINSLVFIRAMEGRFVTIFYTYKIPTKTLSYTLFTEQNVYDKNNVDSCNVDLGLGTFRVKDDQISASSWLPEYQPSHARPHSSGWCATFNDANPYIEIKFPETVIIEGITIYNWEKIISFNEQETSLPVLFGVTELMLLYKDNEGNLISYTKSIIFDTSRAFTQPQTFWLANHHASTYVRIMILEAATVGLNCIKFELQGCYSTSNYQLVNTVLTKQNKFKYMYEDMSLVSEISSAGIIMSSIDLPHRYESDQIYRWIIRLEDQKFIKLVFTDVSFKGRKELQDDVHSACSDSLIISDDLTDISSGRVIDHSFRIKFSMTVATSETKLVMSLFKCSSTLMQDSGDGFTAILKYEDTPACFSLRPRVPWSQGLLETCNQPTMLLTSMHYLGVPFVKTTERWSISVPMYQINLQIIEFYVTCQTEYIKSLFKVINMDQERVYCNFDRPPDIIKSSYSTLIVSFYKDVDLRNNSLQLDGFKMVYTTSRQTIAHRIDYMETYSTDRNVALGKPAVVPDDMQTTLFLPFSSRNATKATDGHTFQDIASGSCFLVLHYDLWWMVDLQGIYRLDYIVIYNALTMPDSAFELRDLELSTGLSVYGMQVTGLACGKIGSIATIIQTGIKARYIRLKQNGNALKQNARFSLCEVKVFGKQVSAVSHTSLGVEFAVPSAVDGQWGQWSSWENICYKGKQMRYRNCDNPQRDYRGAPCRGSDSSYQICTPEGNVEDKVMDVYPMYKDMSNLTSVVVGYDRNADLSEKGYIPWLLVDLNTVDRLVYVTLSFEAFSDLLRRNGDQEEYVALSSGITLCDFKVLYYYRECGDDSREKMIRLNGTRAKYVKLHLSGIILKEFKIYRQTVYNDSITYENNSCIAENSVDGGFSKWSEWGKCSANCGQGLKTRRRQCSNPGQAGSGLPCFGDDVEHQPCIGNGSCLVCANIFGKCYSILSRLTNWNQARLECRKRKMNLVSILSLQEMHFIKTLLRERRYLDGHPVNVFHADYHVHIGLHFENSDIFPVWDNDLVVTFTAWKSRPVALQCTRMNFKFFDEDNSWETEDCVHQLAEYIMCEHWSGNKTDSPDTTTILHNDGKVEIHEQIPSWEYNGTLNTAISGSKCRERCESWGGSTLCYPKYCHDREGMGYVNCFTDRMINDECSVNLPNVNNSDVMFYMYKGKLNTTFSGKTCQRWDKQSPHNHDFHGKHFKGEGISEAANYCRDPGDTGTLWCFTTHFATRWEPCLLNELKVERHCTIDLVYKGTINVTLSGKTCLRWDEIQDPDIPAETISNAENFCRDPYKYGYNWCYVYSFQQNGDFITTEPCQYIETKPLAYVANVTKMVEDIFMCENELLIPQFSRCNGIFDCADMSDETNCLNKYEPHPLVESEHDRDLPKSFEVGSHFQCSTKEWISLIARCDGIIDCFDGSDETKCYHRALGPFNCTVEEFMCTNGDCIHISQVCNFIHDCIDSSDEYCDFGQCLPSEYQCDSGQCISSNQRCDAIEQCIDGSDEFNCDGCQPNVAFQCDVTRCVPFRLRCDDYVDCDDGSDEEFCDDVVFTSCQELWEAGYRQSGKYVIDGIKVDCKFDDVDDAGKLNTIVNFDIYCQNEAITNFLRYLINRPLKFVDGLLNSMLTRLNCTQQIKKMCNPPYATALAFVESNTTCDCSILSFHIGSDISEPASITECSGTSRKNWTNSTKQYIYFSYEERAGLRLVEVDTDFPDYYHIIAGPAICEQDYKTTNSSFACQMHGYIIPMTQRCVYDVDQSGFSIGCRDGSHLHDCENYDCPQNTVHCPNSYCIALRFVCDGELHCPGGEDEENCGCAPSNNEILIIHDEEIPISLDMSKFARQFKTHTNIVRILSYKTSKPLLSYGIANYLLDISDVEATRSTNVANLVECNYKVMAKELINSIRFVNTGLKGFILIQSDAKSEDVNDEILEDIHSIGKDIRIYRVKETSEQLPASYNQTTVPLVKDVHIKRWQKVKAVGAEYFSELCSITSKVDCADGYKCAASKTCIPVEQVCDGHRQCLHGDDEVLCNFICPKNCTCAGFYTDCSQTDFDLSMISSISKNTRLLDLSSNHKLSLVLLESRLIIKLLSVLNLSDCNVETVSPHAFYRIRNLRFLDLSFNKLTRISDFVFSNLKRLTKLILHGNADIAVIETSAFDGLSRVQDSDFANMKLSKISTRTFSGLNLTNIDLSNNKLMEIEDFAFSDSSVKNINFEGNDIKQLNKEIFTGLIGLKTLKTSAFKFCCIRPNYLSEENCYPRKDEFSSCEDLMRNSALQFMLWLVGVAALIGNFLTIIYRVKYDRKRLKLGFGIFVTNLAVADFCMGVYLVIIAIADAAFRKRYIYNADYWKNSGWCNFAGIMSTMSSEASVLFLCLITIDRLLVIKYPFGDVRFTKEKAIACAIFAWLFSATVALLPISYEAYFENKFYSRSGVCIALPLTRDRPPGWVYSIAIFVGLNFITFILVAFGQLSIFVGLKESTGIATTAQAARKRDLRVARNLLLVVGTDFMCWIPIGVMGILALSGYSISGDVYAWAAVLILPINSALNPILYTLTAIIGERTFQPSNEENDIKEITRELGQSILKCLEVGHRFTKMNPPISKYCTLDKITNAGVDIPLSSIIAIAFQLAQSLDACHNCSLTIKPLVEHSIYLRRIRKNGRLTGEVKIKGELLISFKLDEKSQNIYEFGICLKNLINATKKTISK